MGHGRAESVSRLAVGRGDESRHRRRPGGADVNPVNGAPAVVIAGRAYKHVCPVDHVYGFAESVSRRAARGGRFDGRRRARDGSGRNDVPVNRALAGVVARSADCDRVADDAPRSALPDAVGLHRDGRPEFVSRRAVARGKLELRGVCRRRPADVCASEEQIRRSLAGVVARSADGD